MPTACPAVGWINELTVEVRGDVTRVAELVACVDDECAPAEARSGDVWVFPVGMSSPDRITVRLLDAEGVVLAQEDTTPRWMRVGGSEECGGPHEATVAVDLHGL